MLQTDLTNRPEDHLQRAQATITTRSFIMQAPAGSGKTEILTQRYLRLLNQVNEPEQIIALTFTKKAAHEMRDRILAALTQAAQNTSATSAHHATTLGYAHAAIARDHQRSWKILQQPSRLRVITIDALCHALMHAMPDTGWHATNISDQPQRLYAEAAHACLKFARETTQVQPLLQILLEHLDNRQDKILTLFCDLLAQREQWLPGLYQAQTQTKTAVEAALVKIERHELDRFQQSVPAVLAAELVHLARQLALIENNPVGARHPLSNWHDFSDLDKECAGAACALLLTTQNTLRKSFDHHVGLKRDTCAADVYTKIKNDSKRLLAELGDYPHILEALIRIKNLPAPKYDPAQWQTLNALFGLLPLLVAHLNLVMHAHNAVDFTAIAQNADSALGDALSPTELALRLDYGIQHLLVDEFQDTSVQQFQLIEKLVAGWESGDGRTLFLVGDPMQSIYRFRSAEVGLFLRARLHGMGPVNLQALTLSCNFRSTAPLVDWINAQFKPMFPVLDDMESGAVSYHPCTSKDASDDKSDCVHAIHTENSLAQAHVLVNTVQAELKDHPQDTLAILVRTRRQLQHILRLFRDQNIPVQGIDIDLLANLAHLRDVWSLTQVLLTPANRLAGLEFLRSPWCGFTLNDLEIFANINPHTSIFSALSQAETLANLSEECRVRARYIHSVISNAWAERHQQGLVKWILDTLEKLHINKILNYEEQEELEQYWNLLETFEKDGLLCDLALFKQSFNRLYSKKVTRSRIHIMTIHKAKGLEFDCVMLPGLSANAARSDTPLLRWLKLPSEHEELVLISPIKAADQDKNPLYDYLAKLDTEKNKYEAQRLLYVAVTRAKKRLYLFDDQYKAKKGSFRDNLRSVDFQTTDCQAAILVGASALPTMTRLPVSFYSKVPHTNPISFQNTQQHFNSSTPRLLGVVAHELLQWICTYHPKELLDVPWQLAIDQLSIFGLDQLTIQDRMEHLKTMIATLFQTPLGQWIMQPHTNERNEYALQVTFNEEIVTRIIDRTFEAGGKQWIIDFKTGAVQESKHLAQVNSYADLMRNICSLPIHCGLYYLDTGLWITWVAE